MLTANLAVERTLRGPSTAALTHLELTMADSSPECSFCRLDEPAVTMYRDATAQAFISLAPINRYPVIVAPRAHYEHLSELPATTVTTAVSLAQRLSAAIIAVALADALHLRFRTRT